ncbi:MAG: GNAT family N-acetyltransferase [Candidatus Aureabacteria bacterium]|nr:GNAT family N-acetyltransferase [Candidatus Auribacterota bacterium]
MNPYTIRPYHTGDRGPVRRICADTALYGTPAAVFAGDVDLIVDGLLDYYILYEPESLFVAERSGTVVGYLSGCVDSRRHDRYLTTRIVPRLVLRWLCRGDCLRAWSWQLMAALTSAGRQRLRHLSPVRDLYPAHCHINLDPEYRGGGIGAALWDAFRERLMALHVPGIHISSPTEGGKRFFAKLGFTRLAAFPAPPLGGVSPGEIWLMVLRLG